MQVAIIGGGIAGPLLTLTLQKSGIAYTVFESRPAEATSSGFTLTANSLHALDALGLYKGVRDAVAEFSTTSYLNANFKLLANFNLGSVENYGFPALNVRKEALRALLLDKCREDGNVEVRYGLECFGIRDSGGAREGALELFFRNSSGSPSPATEKLDSPDVVTVSADLVVGADGFDSAVRRICFPGAAEPEYFGLVSMTGRIPRSALPTAKVPSACSLFSKSNFLALKPCPSNTPGKAPELSFVANFPHDDLSVEQWCRLQSVDGHEERLKMLVDEYCCEDSPWPSSLRDVLAQQRGEEITCWPHYTLPELPSYLAMSKRVVLIGDAAHGMPPTTAQGGNAAIEDAHTLGLVIASACSRGDNLGVSLTNWENHRRPRIKKILEHDLQGSNLILKRSSARAQKIKETAVKVLYKTVLGGSGGLKWVFEYDATKTLQVIEKETAGKKERKARKASD